MKLASWLSVCAITFVLLVVQPQVKTARAQSRPEQPTATIEGLVRDVACASRYPGQVTATHLGMKCLLACAKNGSTLGILTKNGDIYLPISNDMPDTSQRERLIPYLGKYVQANGAVYQRNGTRTIAISEIKELKDVHITVDE